MLHTEQHIAGLIFQHFSGELSSSGKEVLENWLSASPRNRDFFNSLEKENTLFSIVEEDERDKKENLQQLIFEKILLKIEEPEVPLIKLENTSYFQQTWWKFAAAVILIVGGAIFIWQPREQPQIVQKVQVPEVQNDLMPGSNKAVLTLSDGRRVVLDSRGKQVIEESGTSITDNSGEIVYTKTGVSVANMMTTPKGGQYKIILSDGTRVWLNSASSISYPTFFSGKTREVSVTGEVYFEVAENKNAPFIVNVPGNAKIEVLGTRFNVNVYDDESLQVTTLVEGSVRMKHNTGSVVIAPGQQALLAKKVGLANAFQIQSANIEQALAWRNNFFVFNKSDLPAVMRQLSRWYDLEIEYSSSQIPQRSFKGKIPMDIPLSQVLNALAKMDVNFEIKGKTLVVSP